MTSTLPQTAPPQDRSLRILPIHVNLLPTEVSDARRVRRLQRVVVASFVGFLVLIAVWWGVASMSTASARGDLEDTQNEADRLVAQQRSFARLSAVQAESRGIETQLKALFADDLQWSDLLHSVQKAPPAGVQITGVTGNLRQGLPPAGGGAVALPNPSGARLVGSISIQGTATNKRAIADYADVLGKLPALANPLLTGVNTQDRVSHFTITADITEAAIGGRFATPKKGVK